MMCMIVEVLVTWLESKAIILPDTLRYSTAAKFEEDEETWEKEAWSIVLEFTEPPAKQGNPSRGKARFLVENAPEDRLVSGKIFEMYEGMKKVAEVTIL